MRCRVTIKGQLTGPMATALAPSATEESDVGTTFTFDVRDQAEWWGLLAHLNDLGLEILVLSCDPQVDAAPSPVTSSALRDDGRSPY